jgi:hypothetical protein
MAVMLPLSIYIAIVNPVADCGCFGDFLILSNTVTCIKNIVIVAAVIWLWRYNAKVRGLYMPYIQWIELTIGGAYMLIVGLIGYHEQPLLDFRQYKIGTKLMNNAAPDIKFIYEKDGSRQSFSIAELPDSTWTYIDRIEPETVHSELALYDMASDEEVTDDVATTLDSGDAFILLIQDLKKAGVANTYILNELNSYITSRGGIMFALVDAKSDDVAEWIDLAMAEYQIYKTEATSIKEIARGNMSVVYCHNGIIVWKRTLWSIGTELFQAHNSSEWLTESRPISGTRIFWCLTLICGGLLFILWAASKSAIGLHHRFIASHGYGINKASENQSE